MLVELGLAIKKTSPFKHTILAELANGAIGYIAADGSMEFNVAIRTMIINRKDGLVHVPAGGGIVADSRPAEEYEETIVKARAMFEALRIEWKNH